MYLRPFLTFETVLNMVTLSCIWDTSFLFEIFTGLLISLLNYFEKLLDLFEIFCHVLSLCFKYFLTSLRLLCMCLRPFLLYLRTFLVSDFPGAPVIKNCLPMQEAWVRSLIQEDSTCCGATKPMHNYWAHALEPGSHNYWSLSALEPMPAPTTREATTKRSPHTTTREELQLAATRENLHAAMKTQHSQK